MKIHTPEEIAALPLMQFKALEALLRRTLLRRGYALSRSRARDKRSATYGKYLITSTWSGEVVGDGYQPLWKVEQWIDTDEKKREPLR
jgi:hypothetical protein